MKRCFSLAAAAVFFLILPGPSNSQQEAEIPPMLEGHRPLATPNIKPAPRPPEGNKAKSVSPAKKAKKTKKATKATKGKKRQKAKLKKSGKRKTAVAGKKKGKKASKKKRGNRQTAQQVQGQ